MIQLSERTLGDWLEHWAKETPDKEYILKSATPFPKCYLHKEKWTFDS